MAFDHQAIDTSYMLEQLSVLMIHQVHSVKMEILVSLDDSLVTNARTEIDEEAAKVKYKTDRTTTGSTVYASFADQLHML